jgi:hypothetical protein
MLPTFGKYFPSIILTLCFFFGLTNICFGQQFKVEGKVINQKKEPLGFVNVLLLQKQDSTLLKGNSTMEDGTFSIENIAAGTYILKLSFIGYEKIFKEINVTSDVTLETLTLKPVPEELDDITLTGKKNVPKLKRLVDRLVFKVAETTLTETNIWDLLNRTPGVILVNNEITVKGSSNIQILINDRRVSLPKEDLLNLLRGTQANNVESVEIITNPPAKYDAEGGILININMNKNIAAGYNGNVFVNYEVGVFPKLTVGTGHVIKREKTQLSFNYTVVENKNLALQNELVNFIQNGETASIWNTDVERVTNKQTHTASIFFDFNPNQNNSFSISAIGSILPSYDRQFKTNTLINDADSIPRSSFFTINDVDEDNTKLIFNFDYTRKLNNKGAKLAINSGYTYFEKENLQDIDTDFFFPDGTKTGDNDFTTDSDQRIQIYNMQADFNFPLEKNGEIETGVKFASINSLNTVEQPGFDVTQPGEDPTENDRFDYDETIAAAYFSYSKSWSKWNLRAGLRAEYTETDGVSEIQGAINNNDYLELFPTFSLQYMPNEKHNLALNYGRSIERPRYAMINPFRYFIGNNMFVQGDPALLPSFQDFATLSYTLNDTYMFEVYYRFNNNALRYLTFQDNDSRIMQYLNTNIDRELSYGLDFYTYKSFIGFWDSAILASYFYSTERFRNVQNQNNLIDNGLWTLYLSFENYFTISAKKGITAELNAEYVSEVILGNQRQEDYNIINASVSKKLFNNQGVLTLGIRDIFNNQNARTNRVFDNQSSTSFIRQETRLFTFAFRYKFGNTRLQNNNNTKTIQERERLN